MEYSIHALAEMAGVTTRTLRYYDKIGLLVPAYINGSGYRIYTSREADILQQVLFYKSLGMELRAIKDMMQEPGFDRQKALQDQLTQLQNQRRQMDLLIDNIQRTIQHEKGEITMSDKEKFEGFKQELVDENEHKYGAEVREKYGDKTVDESNARMMKLSQEQYDKMQQIATEILTLLESAVEQKASPQSEAGKKIAVLHREWLGFTWPNYSREAHIGLGEMYVADERFKAYYDSNVEGCAQFLCEAIKEHM